jgi:putative heme transporter
MTALLRQLRSNHIVVGILFALALWLLFQVRFLLEILFISFILSAALVPAVDHLERKGVHRSVASFGLVSAALLLIGGVVTLVMPDVIHQAVVFLGDLPQYLDRLGDALHLQLEFSQLQQTVIERLNGLSDTVVGVTATVAGGVFAVFTVLVITFFWLNQYHQIKRWLLGLFGSSRAATRAYARTETRLGKWVRGQLILSVTIGIFDLIAYLIIGLPLAAFLAVLAALLEVVPVLGPAIAYVPAVLIALSVSPKTAVVVTVVYLVIQIVEANVLAPKILSRSVGVHPIVVIVALVAGSELAGVLGAVLALPLTLTGIAIYQGWRGEHPKLAKT